MKTKVWKIIIFTIAFFVGLTPTMAREVNFKELNEAVENMKPKASYYYVVGEYVYTSTYGEKNGVIKDNLSTQDFMLSARSIAPAAGDKKGDAIYDAMTVSYVSKNSKGAWEIKAPIMGTTKLGTLIDNVKKINIKYIDYELVKEVVNTDSLVKKATEDISKELFSSSIKDHEVTVKVLKGDTTIEEGMSSGVILAFSNMLNDKNVKEIQFKYNDVSYVFKKSGSEDIVEWWNTNKSKIFGKDDEIVTKDLAGKEFTASIVLNDEATSQNSKSIENYTIKFEFEESAKPLLQKELDKVNKSYFKPKFKDNSETEIEVDVVNPKLKLADITGSKIFETFTEILNNPDIEEVKLTYGDISKTFTSKNNDVYSWLFENIETILGKGATLETLVNEMIGKEFKVDVVLKDGIIATETNNSKVSYTFTFTGKKLTAVKEEEITSFITENGVISGRSDFTSSYNVENKTLTVTILDIEEGIEKVHETGIIDSITSLLKDGKVKSIDVTFSGETTTFDDINILYTKAIELLTKMAADKKLGSLENDILKVKINLKEDAAYFDNLDKTTVSNEYTVEFKVQTYEIEYKYNNNGTTEDTKKSLKGGESLETPTWDKEHLFKGWYDGDIEVKKAVKNQTVTAKWLTVINTDNYIIENVIPMTAERDDFNFQYITGSYQLKTEIKKVDKKFLEMVNSGTNILATITKLLKSDEISKFVVNDYEFSNPDTVYADVVNVLKKLTNSKTDEELFAKRISSLLDVTELKVKVVLNPEYAIFADSAKELEKTYTITFENKDTSGLKVVTKKNLANIGQSAITSGISNQTATKGVSAYVEGNVINVNFAETDSVSDPRNQTAYSVLDGCGARTSLENFLKNENIASIEISFEGMDPVTVVAENVSRVQFLFFASKFLEPFKQATNKDATSMTIGEIAEVANKIKVKVNLKEGKIFTDDILEEYVFNMTFNSN